MRCLSFAAVLALSALALTGLTGCGGGSSGIAAAGSYNPGYGPFDKDGNYIEAWADKPAKKHWWAGRSKPAAAPKPSAPKPTKKAPAIASASTRKPSKATSASPTRPSTRPTEVARLGRTRTVYTPPAKPAYTPRPSKPASRYTPPAPKPTVTYKPPAAKPKPKPAPKPTPVKPSKPPPIRHTIAKGETLYSLSRKYGTTVAAIQRANGIKGTTIITGKTYLIPR